MKFLPTENITYKTKLKDTEVINRLSDLVEPERKFRLGLLSSGSTKPYEGQISGQTFDIKRIIRGRNSFLPIIKGIIQRDLNGTTITVKMRLHIFVMFFLCIWCAVVGLGCIAFLTKAFNNSKFDTTAIIPFGMLLFAYVLTMVGFKSESNKSKKDLQKLFEAETTDL